MAEEANPDVATWDEIKVTSIFTIITTASFLIVFEFSRRNPAVSAVFDRRRASKPSRTPPPLIKSRYFEWLFLSTDPAYIEYSDIAYQKEVIRERKKRKHTLLAGGKRDGTSKVPTVETILEEDSPRKRRKHKHKEPPHRSSRKSTSNKKSQSNSKRMDSSSYNDFLQSKTKAFFPPSPQNKKSLHKDDLRQSGPVDLDDDSVFDLKSNSHSSSESECDNISLPSNDAPALIDSTETPLPRESHTHTSPRAKNRPKQLSNQKQESSRSNATTVVMSNTGRGGGGASIAATTAITKKEAESVQFKFDDLDKLEKGTRVTSYSSKKHKREYSTASNALGQLKQGVVEVNGRRLPAEIAEYAIAGDLTELQLEEYERRLQEREEEEEREYRERVMEGGDKLSRWKLLGFQRGWLGKKGKGEDIIELTDQSKTNATSANAPRRITSGEYQPNRHLSSTVSVHRRPLGIADTELLRCVGLDTFSMIRFLRFGFDITFYPFCFACLILIPTYYTNPYEGDEELGIATNGYFRGTMSRLEPGSPRLWVSWCFALFFFIYILRRLWIEWETFITLRFDFLANGDVEMDIIVHQDYAGEKEKRKQIQLQLEQYRNSCMVEYVPESHRRDKELYEFFDALFPGQVKRAEILLNASQLVKLIQERQQYIEKYENLYAKQLHARAVYRKKKQSHSHTGGNVSICRYICCWCCCGLSPKKPADPKEQISGVCCCRRKMVKALPYYLSEIKRLNRQIEEEHRRILREKEKNEDKEAQGFLAANLAQGLKFVTGGGWDLTCDTGFVEFKNLTAKQSAIQCNIAGTTEYMETKSAPDPRDVVWENSTVERSTIKWKRLQTEALLFTGTLFWSAVVTVVTSISDLESLQNILPPWLFPQDGTFLYSLIQGYLPVILLELLMILIPIILKIIATTYIRFKSKSEVDAFVFLWHFAYRLANLIIIIVASSLQDSVKDLVENPKVLVERLATGISQTSQFFLNNMIVQAGSETFWELAQMPNMIKHFVMYKFITVEAKSKRALEKLQEADMFDWGEVVPSFIFSLMVGIIYCIQVPIVTGTAAIFFYLATKVYIHQALFVYAQAYEGGGRLMYPLNRTIFTILYIAIAMFSINLGLKEAPIQAPTFFFCVTGITFIVDKKIQDTFVNPSSTLALTNARIIDEENKRKEERAKRFQEYKKLKKEKRKVAAKAAARAKRMAKKGFKAVVHKADDTSITSIKSPLSPSASSESKDSELKPTQFKVWKEDSPEKLKERLAAAEDNSKKDGNALLAEPFEDDSEDEVKKNDFYLYRQPHLNKALWETKPRPYR